MNLQLFLLHMDNIILTAVNKKPIDQPYGCSSICVNQPGQVCNVSLKLIKFIKTWDKKKFVEIYND